MLCPQHVSNALPCDKQGTDTKENYNASSLHQRFCDPSFPFLRDT
jgi:hypothetical protein